jgi:hypothetical protein
MGTYPNEDLVVLAKTCDLILTQLLLLFKQSLRSLTQVEESFSLLPCSQGKPDVSSSKDVGVDHVQLLVALKLTK